MQKLTIRKANMADIDYIVDLLTGYRSFYKCDTDQSSLLKFVEARVKNNESIIFLAFLENEAIGIAQLYPTFTTLGLGKIWILNDLFVSSTRRGSGFGKALLDAVVEFAKEDQAKRIYLKTEYDNMPAKKLYEQYGFKPDLKFSHYILEI